MTDSFYTPKVLADKLISYIDHRCKFTNVVDFCVGNGELLRAAEDRWKEITCYGSDISDVAITDTKSSHSNWLLERFDFLDPSFSDSSNLVKLRNKFDLILLNPPFSCRSGTLNYSNINGYQFSTSTSMKFVLESLKFMSSEGMMYAILPLSVAYSQKDKKVWNYLEREYNLTILEETSTKYFKDCTPNIILVSINDFNQHKKILNNNRSGSSFEGLDVFRGKLSVHEIVKYPGNYHFVHTTNLRNNEITNLSIQVEYLTSLVQGPAVLLPRVGKPEFSKVCILNKGEEYCISDCIIALRCESEDLAETVFSYLYSNWEGFSALYRGTGAHYITNQKVIQYLNLDLVENELTTLLI